MIPAKVASFIALNSNSVSFFFQRVFVEGRLHNRFFTLREMGLNPPIQRFTSVTPTLIIVLNVPLKSVL